MGSSTTTDGKGTNGPPRDSKQAERPAGEISFQTLFNLSGELLCVVGTDGFFRKVNPAFTRILGYSASELLFTPVIELVHADDRGLVAEQIDTLSASGPAISFVCRHRCKDGGEKAVTWIARGTGNGIFYAAGRDASAPRPLLDMLGDDREIFTRQIAKLQTELAQARTEKNRVQQQHRSLTAGHVGRLRTAANNMMDLAHELRETTRGSAQDRLGLETIEATAAHMLAVLREAEQSRRSSEPTGNPRSSSR